VLIHPWDSALDENEWRTWLAVRDFGQLVANGVDGGWPVVVPTHFIVADDRHVLLHLARPNPVWKAIEANPRVLLTVIDDYVFVPGTWRNAPEVPPTDGVPTSYYAAVQLVCTATILDDPHEKAALLRRQLAHFQPEGDHAAVEVDAEPYGRLLSGIRGLRLEVEEARAKFKYDGHKPAELRLSVSERLAQRGGRNDAAARAHQLRRLGSQE
jgi:transcriptional regulator